VGELVGELHRDATAQAVAHERRPLVPEHGQQVADARRVGAEAVVAAWLGRLAVAEQVGGDDRVVLAEQGHDRHPGRGAARDAVDEHDHRSLAERAVGHLVAVDMGRAHGRRLGDALDVALAGLSPPAAGGAAHGLRSYDG